MPVKKSLYIFLCSIMGAMLFIIIQQILAFAYLMLLYANYQAFSFGLQFEALTAVNYFLLFIALLLGAWYGIWLGIYWFGLVYENGGHGFIGHLVKNYWPGEKKYYDLKSKILVVERKLEGNLTELENIGRDPEKKVVRKKIARRNKTP